MLSKRTLLAAALVIALQALLLLQRAAATSVAVNATKPAPLNPWTAFDGPASYSFRLGFEISASLASDGQFYYARGCCYGHEYDLQLWGTGLRGTALGASYGTVSAPPVGLDNGRESVLLYLPARNRLVYWRWDAPEVHVARGRAVRAGAADAYQSLRWAAVNLVALGERAVSAALSGGRASLSTDGADVLLYDHRARAVHRLSGQDFSLQQTTALASADGILPPGANEDLHSFASDGEHWLFGSHHSGHCYAVYSARSGEHLGSQCARLGGSMLSFDWSLESYQACGTDAAAPPADAVFNAEHGNGAHCSVWPTARSPALAVDTAVLAQADARAHDGEGAGGGGGEDDGAGGDEGGIVGGDDDGAESTSWLFHDAPGREAVGVRVRAPAAPERVCEAGFPLLAGAYTDANGNAWALEQDHCALSLSFAYVTAQAWLARAPATGAWGDADLYLEVASQQDPAYPGFGAPLVVRDRRTLSLGADIVLTRDG